MTALEFGEKNYKSNKLIIVMVVGIVFSAIFGVAKYTQLIGLRHDLDNFRSQISKLQVENAEQKNLLYQKMDVQLTESNPEIAGLVHDKDPIYVSGANN